MIMLVRYLLDIRGTLSGSKGSPKVIRGPYINIYAYATMVR